MHFTLFLPHWSTGENFYRDESNTFRPVCSNTSRGSWSIFITLTVLVNIKNIVPCINLMAHFLGLFASDRHWLLYWDYRNKNLKIFAWAYSTFWWQVTKMRTQRVCGCEKGRRRKKFRETTVDREREMKWAKRKKETEKRKTKRSIR